MIAIGILILMCEIVRTVISAIAFLFVLAFFSSIVKKSRFYNKS